MISKNVKRCFFWGIPIVLFFFVSVVFLYIVLLGHYITKRDMDYAKIDTRVFKHKLKNEIEVKIIDDYKIDLQGIYKKLTYEIENEFKGVFLRQMIVKYNIQENIYYFEEAVFYIEAENTEKWLTDTDVKKKQFHIGSNVKVSNQNISEITFFTTERPDFENYKKQRGGKEVEKWKFNNDDVINKLSKMYSIKNGKVTLSIKLGRKNNPCLWEVSLVEYKKSHESSLSTILINFDTGDIETY